MKRPTRAAPIAGLTMFAVAMLCCATSFASCLRGYAGGNETSVRGGGLQAHRCGVKTGCTVSSPGRLELVASESEPG